MISGNTIQITISKQLYDELLEATHKHTALHSEFMHLFCDSDDTGNIYKQRSLLSIASAVLRAKQEAICAAIILEEIKS